MALIPWGKLLSERRRCGWLTLTVPEVATAADIKRDFKAFVLRLERAYPGTAAVWRLEYQERGAAHLHVLVVFPGEGPACFLGWAIDAWRGITGSPSQAVHYRWVTSWRGLLCYMADASKKGQGRPPVDKATGEVLDSPGRWWGTVGGLAAYFGRVVTLWGAGAWASCRRAIAGLSERRRRERCRRIIAYLRRKGRPDALERIARVKRWASKRVSWRPGFAFLQDVPGFARWVEGMATGPAAVQGLSSVAYGGRVTVWEGVRWVPAGGKVLRFRDNRPVPVVIVRLGDLAPAVAKGE